jgi:phenolic acid decarboxylase
MSGETYAGHTYPFRVDNGVVFRNTYSEDGSRLRYETLEGPTAGAGEEVELQAAEIAPRLFFISWVEASGMTVSHAMNLNTKTVHAFWTWQDDGGR